MGRFEEGNEDDRDFQPFTEEILREPIPAGYVFPKMGTFVGKQDPGVHLKNFRTQMLICGGSEATKCKMFAGTLVGTMLDWFSSLPEGSVMSFEVFTRLFMAHFSANKVKPLGLADLFKLKQAKKESIKQFLCRFSDLVK